MVKYLPAKKSALSCSRLRGNCPGAWAPSTTDSTPRSRQRATNSANGRTTALGLVMTSKRQNDVLRWVKDIS